MRGVKLVIAEAHEGLKTAVAKVLHASWQRCRVHFMRNVLAHAGKQGRRVVAAFMPPLLPKRTLKWPASSGARLLISAGPRSQSDG